MVLLREIERPHHFDRIRLEQVSPIGVKLSLANEERSHFDLSAASQGQKTEERPGAVCCVTARELLGDSLRYPENVAGVFVVIAHQRFTCALAFSLAVTQTLRDFRLLIQIENVGGPAG